MALGYYRTGDLLRAKHKLAAFDSGRRFEQWALRLVPISAGWQILDTGCGWGRFTWSLVDDFHVPAAQMSCVDRSHGMLLTLREEAERRGVHPRQPRECQASIEALPFQSHGFDFAVAGHVLYHLHDITRGAHELARVLRPDGTLLATTNADDVNVLILNLHYQALQELGIAAAREEGGEGRSPFSMENGRSLLEQAFGWIDVRSFRDTTSWPDVTSFMAGYRTLGRYQDVMADPSIPRPKRDRLAVQVEELAAETLAREGALRSDVLMGAFICRQPRREITT